MTDRELFHCAAGTFRSLVLPVGGTLLAVRLLRGSLPRTLASVFVLGAERFFRMEPDGAGAVGLLLLLPFALAGELAAELLSLGAFRACLERAEQGRSQRPWAILGQWRRYQSWVLWMAGMSIVQQVGGSVLRVYLAHSMDDVSFSRFNIRMNYFNVVLSVFSLVFFMLLFLSVRTAYLRAPERGFWPSVDFGVREGLRKWPQTVGAQVKFVVPVSLGTGLAAVLLRKLAFQIGSTGLSQLSSGLGSFLELLAETWVLIFYGYLAAERYDLPQGGE